MLLDLLQNGESLLKVGYVSLRKLGQKEVLIIGLVLFD